MISKLSLGRLNVAVEQIGTGPSLCLIHGLGSSGADWAFQVRDLKPHFRLILPDLRGSGRSDAPLGPYSIPQFAQDMWDLLDALGEREVGLLGFSLGGAVALEMALMRPHAVTRLMTINSLPSYRVNTLAKVLEVYGQQLAVRSFGLERVARMVSARLFPEPHQHAMRQRVVDVLGGLPVKPYLHSARALAGWCALKRLDALKTPLPLLMLAAEYDYTPLAEKLKFAARLRAPVCVIKGSRHGTPFDAILAVNRLALEWFSGAQIDPRASYCADKPEEVPIAPP